MPAIGVEADIDKSRPNGLSFVGSETKRLERAGPVTVNQDVTAGDQRSQLGKAGRRLRIESGAALAERRLGGSRFIPGRGVDPENVSAEPGEEAGRGRSGQNPGEIEDSDA